MYARVRGNKLVTNSFERIVRGLAASRIGRRRLLAGSMALASGGLAASAGPLHAERLPRVGQAQPAGAGGSIVVRWIGGGVLEVASPDSKQIALVDAWVWNNNGAYQIFGV